MFRHERWSLLLALIVAFHAAPAPCQSSSSSDSSSSLTRIERVDVPLTANFKRRAQMNVAVLGNYLYIEGGRLSQDNHVPQNSSEWSEAKTANVTLAISLDESWTNDTVNFIQIPRDMPSMMNYGLWPTPDGDSMYAWGGQLRNEDPRQDLASPKLRLFTRDDPAGKNPAGKWTYQGEPGKSPAKVLRTWLGGSASCGGVGYYLGGQLQMMTDDASGNITSNLPGLITYDMGTGEWKNVSASGFGPDTTQRVRGTLIDGSAVCLPMFGSAGSSGLVLFLSGQQEDLGVGSKAVGMTMNRIYVFDVASQKFYSQATTGDIPESRRAACAVVVQAADAKSYEVYLFGGSGQPGDVYILTVPGFRWFRAPVNTTVSERNTHACAVKGRQMFSVGGYDSLMYTQRDPWKNGLGVFDMTLMQWRPSYDASLGAYEMPSLVKDWYTASYTSVDSLTWDNDATKLLFRDPSDPLRVTVEPATAVPIGAIAGGVVGGVFGLGFLILGFLLLRRRHRRNLDRQHRELETPFAHELGPNPDDATGRGYAGPQMLDSKGKYDTELPGTLLAVEMDHDGSARKLVYEMSHFNQPQELEADNSAHLASLARQAQANEKYA